MKKTSKPPPNSLQLYKQLVDAILSEKPDEAVIKELMSRLGIEYKENTIDRLSAVLAFNPNTAPKGRPYDLQ